MKHWLVGMALAGVSSGVATAVPSVPAAPSPIRNLQGCFRVAYRFVEDGLHDYEINAALEWITVTEAAGGYVVTHYGIDGSTVTEHFKEHWTRLSDTRWRQQIGSTEAPRYTCESDVRFGQLRCASPGAAKPIRDRKRTDYDLLNRVSTIQVTPAGWVQNEVNDKVTKAGTVVATEVGWIEYRRTPDEASCQRAKALHSDD
jgi:hypothetical protein